MEVLIAAFDLLKNDAENIQVFKQLENHIFLNLKYTRFTKL